MVLSRPTRIATAQARRVTKNPNPPRWQGRFGARRLKDVAELLVCSLYVNMNPIRAGLAQTPEEAEHTSTYARMQDRQTGDPNLSNSGWLSPVHVDGDDYDGVRTRRRASNKSFLEISFVEQLELLDALVRRERIEKAGGTSSDFPPVLERLRVSAAKWEQLERRMSRRFTRELIQMVKTFAKVSCPVVQPAKICTLFPNACWGEVSHLRRSRDGQKTKTGCDRRDGGRGVPRLVEDGAAGISDGSRPANGSRLQLPQGADRTAARGARQRVRDRLL